MITMDDINLWLKQANTAAMSLDSLQGETKEIKSLIKDFLYLVAFVESLLCINESEGVLARAKDLQREIVG